jgi:hypothetical protein
MNIVISAAILSVFVGLLPVGRDCHCRPAANDEAPSSGNMVVTMNAGTVREARGIVTDANGALFEDAVVEVYRLDSGISVNDAYKVVTDNQRLSACVTGKNGQFCFADLPPGRYVLRAGLKSSGWDPIYVTVQINPQKRSDPRKGLALPISPSG